MRQYTWAEYFDGFYDWSTSTQIAYSRQLTNFGPPDEVFEVAQEIAYGHENYASSFIQNALNAGVRFTPEQVIEGSIFLDKETVDQMATSSSRPFSREELEDIYQIVGDSTFAAISKRANIDIFADEAEQEDFEDNAFPDYPEAEGSAGSASKVGFFATLLAFLGSTKAGGHHHRGKCDGDCAHCPPHYGYRYGRWYYGHGHQYGCEFGGNKGDGSL